MTRRLLDEYPHRIGGHCGSGALRDIAEWAGLGWDGPPSEGLVFGLGGGLSFYYVRTSLLRPPVYLVGRNGDMELDVCRRFGIDVDLRRTDDAQAAWGWVTDELDAGRPVMLWADIMDLPYLDVRLPNTRHDIVVVGYDDDEGLVHVVDNDRAEIQVVSMEELATARSSTRFPGPARHGTFVLRFPDETPDLLPAARAAARSAVANMQSAEAPFEGLDQLDGVTGFGLEGVARFADDIVIWRDVLEEEDVTFAIRMLPVFIEKAGTGGGLFRRLQAQFCEDVHRMSGDSTFEAAAAAWRQAADGWSDLGRAATDDDRELQPAAARLVALEEAAVDALAACGET